MITAEDEPIEKMSLNEIRDYDPIKPEHGFYYLWNELTDSIHTHFSGENHFNTYDYCRFVRSCSTMWPFLKIYRHWIRRKEDAPKNKRIRDNFYRMLL